MSKNQTQRRQVSTSSSSKITNPLPLRRGKWTPEEETYVVAAIRAFNSGYLDAPPGTTLRTYLSRKLQCDPMRITKKFSGDASIGKKIFHPAVTKDPDAKVPKSMEDTQANLDDLYKKWRHQLQYQEQGMAQKYMATEAVSLFRDNKHVSFSTASSECRLPSGGDPKIANPGSGGKSAHSKSAKAKHDMLKTASWLEHAEAVLSKKTQSKMAAEREIKEEMKEIANLIREAAGLPKLPGNRSNIETSGRLQAQIHKLHSRPDLEMLQTEQEPNLEASSKESASALAICQRKRSLSEGDTLQDTLNNPMKEHGLN